MITKQKNRIIYILITLFIISFSVITTDIKVNAADKKSKKIDLVVLFDNDAINTDVKDLVINSGGDIIKEMPELGGIEVECTPDLIPTIKSQEGVQSLAPNHIIELSAGEVQKAFKPEASTSAAVDLFDKYQWDIKRVTNNGESFKKEAGNHDVVVGIVDSGVDTTHPDLANNYMGGKNLIPSNFEGDSTETGDINDVEDRIGHGTNSAGAIAANGKIKGVAPNIGFKSYRVFNKNAHTDATICSSAIVEATDDGVNVINLSLGGYDLKGKCYWTDPDTGIEYYLGDDMAEYSLLKRAIKYAIKNDVTVVAAAGNEGQDCSNKKKLTDYFNGVYSAYGFRYEGLTYEAPGTVKDVITVSATDKEDKLASYSNYGKKFIDVAAPGGDSSKPLDPAKLCVATTINSGYTYTAGTSIAAPKVAAVAALILCDNKGLSPKKVGKKIYKTADELDGDDSSEYYGAGIVNAYNAIQ